MRFADLVGTSDAVARASGRLEKIALLASLLKRAAPEEIEIATAFLSGTPRQGRIGLGGAALHAARDTPPADDARPRAPRRRQRVWRHSSGVRSRIDAGQSRDPETAARPRDPRRAGFRHAAHRGRPAAGGARRRARRRGGAGGGYSGRAGPPRRDAGRRAGPGGARRARRRRRGPLAVPAPTVSATPADARRCGGRC